MIYFLMRLFTFLESEFPALLNAKSKLWYNALLLPDTSIPLSVERVERGGSVAVKQEELEELLYTPQDEEWAARNPDLECDRISHGLSQIMSLAIAEPFLVPVDLNVYPMYALIIDYPMDLTTIKVWTNIF